VTEIRSIIKNLLAEESIVVDINFIKSGICSLVSQSNRELTIEVPSNDTVIYIFSVLTAGHLRKSLN
jgi:precorrin isomerase